MKKHLFFIISLLAFVSCDIHYTGNEKIRFVIDTKDINMEPIEGIEVQITNSSGGFSEIISKGTTKANGKLELYFPRLDKGSISYNIEFTDPNAIFSSAEIKNITYEDLSQSQLILPTKILARNDELTTLAIDLNRINNNRSLKSIQLIGSTFDAMVDYQSLNNEIDNEFPVFKVFKNQTVTLNYSIVDFNQSAITEENSVQIQITNESLIYYTIDL